MVRLRIAQARLACTLVLSLLAGAVSTSHATQRSAAGIVYQYPLPGAQQMVRETEIGLRARSAYDRSLEGASFAATGSRSGAHQLTPRFAMNGRMLLLHPVVPFAYGETVTVSYFVRLLGGSIVSDTFTFTTKSYAASHATPDDAERAGIETARDARVARTLSADILPVMTVTVDSGAVTGSMYFSNFGITKLPNDNDLLVIDEHGVLQKSRLLPSDYAADFKIQPTGLITYYDFDAAQFYGMDPAWNIIDTFSVATGYQGDSHELRIFPDGSYALIADELLDVNMSQNVAGGSTDALVTSNCIQVFDAQRNLIFNWRGYNHYLVADAIHENLHAAKIDYEHANSLDFDSLGNIILSNRQLCEITKINGETGDIIWRFGGAHNQFKLMNDSIWFSYQHAARLLPEGHLTLFDNSNFDTVIGHSVWFNKTRALEYVLDTVNMTATLVWQFHHTPETYAMFMGYVQRLPNGNTLIGWGGSNDVAITEVRPDNTTAFELSMWPGNYSYRAIKYPRDTVAATSASVASGQQPDGESLTIAQNVDGTHASVQYVLSQPGSCSIVMYDVLGRQIRTIASEAMASVGDHSVLLDLTMLPPGAYYVVLDSPAGRTLAEFERP